MGWYAEGADDHEGYVDLVLADGRRTSSTTGGGVVLTTVTDQDRAAGCPVRTYPGTDYVDVVVPWDQVVSWVVTCSCGWTGSERPAVPDEDGNRDCDPILEEDVFRPEWVAHVQPATILSNLGRLVEELRSLEGQVVEAIHTVRRDGASWSQVGRVLSVSKQAAQQRWG